MANWSRALNMSCLLCTDKGELSLFAQTSSCNLCDICNICNIRVDHKQADAYGDSSVMLKRACT